MFLRYIHTFTAVTVAFSANALAQRHVPVKSSSAYGVETHSAPIDSTIRGGDTEDDEGADYDLRIISLKPIFGAAHDAYDTLIFTITNAGSDTSHVAKLFVGTKSKSLVANVANIGASNAHVATRVVIPVIPPGGRVMLRVRVPKLRGDSTCYAGSIELPDEP